MTGFQRTIATLGGIAALTAATTAGAAERVDDVREDFEWLQANVFAAAPDVFPPSVRSAPPPTARYSVSPVP